MVPSNNTWIKGHGHVMLKGGYGERYSIISGRWIFVVRHRGWKRSRIQVITVKWCDPLQRKKVTADKMNRCFPAVEQLNGEYKARRSAWSVTTVVSLDASLIFERGRVGGSDSQRHFCVGFLGCNTINKMQFFCCHFFDVVWREERLKERCGVFWHDVWNRETILRFLKKVEFTECLFPQRDGQMSEIQSRKKDSKLK